MQYSEYGDSIDMGEKYQAYWEGGGGGDSVPHSGM